MQAGDRRASDDLHAWAPRQLHPLSLQIAGRAQSSQSWPIGSEFRGPASETWATAALTRLSLVVAGVEREEGLHLAVERTQLADIDRPSPPRPGKAVTASRRAISGSSGRPRRAMCHPGHGCGSNSTRGTCSAASRRVQRRTGFIGAVDVAAFEHDDRLPAIGKLAGHRIARQARPDDAHLSAQHRHRLDESSTVLGRTSLRQANMGEICGYASSDYEFVERRAIQTILPRAIAASFGLLSTSAYRAASRTVFFEAVPPRLSLFLCWEIKKGGTDRKAPAWCWQTFDQVIPSTVQEGRKAGPGQDTHQDNRLPEAQSRDIAVIRFTNVLRNRTHPVSNVRHAHRHEPSPDRREY